MFGRGKSEQAEQPGPAAAAVAEPAVKTGGKGRPTPRRREAEQRNRRAMIGAPVVKPGGTKAERKAARRAQREALTAERRKSRQAMMSGDERYLPARDQGPARRFARDYVDARRSPGEYFMPVALLVFVFGLASNPTVAAIASLVLYALLLTVIVDGVLLARRIRRLATERYGEARARGAGLYGVMRSLQLRRMRLPRPQVARGQFPS